MTQSHIIFEQPLNERIRNFLRIEQLMQRFGFCVARDTTFDTHTALTTLLEVVNLAGRGDLKSELMKELKRHIGNLQHLEQTPGVDKQQLQGIIDKHRDLIERLDNLSGQLGSHLKDNDFINSIKQRTAIPGGTCDFDLPAYHYWLAQPAEQRHALLKTWTQPFDLVQEAVGVILTLIRESTTLQHRTAPKGFYQQNLGLEHPNQMIRIRLPDDSRYYPEISAGKHRFTVRFLKQDRLETRAPQADQDIDFELACSAL